MEIPEENFLSYRHLCQNQNVSKENKKKENFHLELVVVYPGFIIP